jgi:type I restriction enzyme S subunit
MTQQWGHETLEDLLALNRSGYWGDETPSEARPIEVKVIRNADLTKHNSIKGSATRYFSAKEAANAELQIGDIAMSSSGDVGKAWLVNEPGYSASNFIRILRPDGNYIMPGFLRYVLESDQGQTALKASTAGTTIQNLQKTFYSMLTVPLPPLAEQQRIVHLLDEALEGISVAKANTEKNLLNAHALVESHLRISLMKSGEGWAQAELGSIGQVLMCKRILKEQTNPIAGVPFYKIGTFGKVADSFIPVELFEKYKSQFAYPKRGEVLLSAAGTIGRRVAFDGEPSYFQDSNIVWIKNDESIILNEYLYYYYSICDFKPSIGTTINRLYNDDLRSLVVFFPQSLAMQRELVSQIVELESASEHLVSLYGRKLDQLHAVRQSLFQHAFSGQLEAA